MPIWERRPNTTRGVPDVKEGNAYNFRLMCLQIGCPRTGNVSRSTATVRMLEQMAGEMGTEIGLPGGITLTVLAASDANPRWEARREKTQIELRRLNNANASAQRKTAFLARPRTAAL